LLKWSGDNTAHYDFVKNYWIAKLGGQTAFDTAIQKGIIEPETMAMSSATFSGNVSDASAKISAMKGAALELVMYEKVGIGRGGVWSNNPWLQELPDPISK